jgi:hypothetical protein
VCAPLTLILVISFRTVSLTKEFPIRQLHCPFSKAYLVILHITFLELVLSSLQETGCCTDRFIVTAAMALVMTVKSKPTYTEYIPVI